MTKEQNKNKNNFKSAMSAWQNLTDRDLLSSTESFEELSDIFKIGVNKLRTEFKNRKIIIKRIR